ncbi:MarR family transcriptional regulator [Nocardiopsis sp. ARC36]
MSLRNVTERLGSTPPSTSRLCDRLQAVGFVHRTASPNSRRELRLYLSESGRMFLRDLRRRRESELHQVLERMPPGSVAMLLEGLTAFRDAADRTPANDPALRPRARPEGPRRGPGRRPRDRLRRRGGAPGALRRGPRSDRRPS